MILRVHTRSVPLADDVHLDQIAQATPGMVGADLANLVNEAALLAARRGHERVQRSDFTDALEKIILGAERKIVLRKTGAGSPTTSRATRSSACSRTRPIPFARCRSSRAARLGVTLSTPDDDRFNLTEQELLASIRVSLGGRVAEEVVYGTSRPERSRTSSTSRASHAGWSPAGE